MDKKQNNIEKKKNGTATIQSVDRALTLLRHIADNPRKKHTLKDLTTLIEIDKSSVFRLLQTLVAHGLLRQEEGFYKLGNTIYTFVSSLYDQEKLFELASPLLQKVADETGHNSHLAIKNGDKALFVSRKIGGARITANTAVGEMEDLYCTSVGRCLICDYSLEDIQNLYEGIVLKRFTERTITDLDELYRELQKVKSSGLSIDNEEFEEGVICCAGPVFDYQKRIIAALGVSGPKEAMLNSLVEIGDNVRNAARKLSVIMGFLE